MSIHYINKKKVMDVKDVGDRLYFFLLSTSTDKASNTNELQELWWPCIKLDSLSQMMDVLARSDLFSEHDVYKTQLEYFDYVVANIDPGDGQMCLLLGASPPNGRRLIYNCTSTDGKSPTGRSSLLPFDLYAISEFLPLQYKNATFFESFVVASKIKSSVLRATLEESPTKDAKQSDKEMIHEVVNVANVCVAREPKVSITNGEEESELMVCKQKTKDIITSHDSPIMNEVSEIAVQQSEIPDKLDTNTSFVNDNSVPATLEKVARRIVFPESELATNKQFMKHYETPMFNEGAAHVDHKNRNLRSSKRFNDSGTETPNDVQVQKRLKLDKSSATLVSLESESPIVRLRDSQTVSDNGRGKHQDSSRTSRVLLETTSECGTLMDSQPCPNTTNSIEPTTVKRAQKQSPVKSSHKSRTIEIVDQNGNFDDPFDVAGMEIVWKLLSKIGFKKNRSRFWLPGKDVTNQNKYVEGKDYFTSEGDLRTFLCAFGIEAQPDSLRSEQIKIVKLWVRSSVIKSVDFSKEGKLQAIKISHVRQVKDYLKRIGFVYNNDRGGWLLPGVDSSMANDGVDIFCNDKELYQYLARHGIPANSNIGDITSEELLSLEVYIANDVTMDVFETKSQLNICGRNSVVQDGRVIHTSSRNRQQPTRLTPEALTASKSTVKKKNKTKSVKPAISSPRHDTNATLVSNYSKDSIRGSSRTINTSSGVNQEKSGVDKVTFVGSIEDKMKACLASLDSTFLSDTNDTVASIEYKLKSCVDQTCFGSGVIGLVAKTAINDFGGSRSVVKLLSKAIQLFLADLKDESKAKVSKLLPIHVLTAKKQLNEKDSQ